MNVNIHGNNISQRKGRQQKQTFSKGWQSTINRDLLQRLRILLYWDLTRGRDRETEIQRRLTFTSLGIRTDMDLKLGLTEVSTTWGLSHRELEGWHWTPEPESCVYIFKIHMDRIWISASALLALDITLNLSDVLKQATFSYVTSQLY